MKKNYQKPVVEEVELQEEEVMGALSKMNGQMFEDLFDFDGLAD